ncbi:hypothetical protein TNCV_2333391 [Trichonephila clavipes]|nr:hypothetical protein TNCV_2333391 [Trichonephila clavipes]
MFTRDGPRNHDLLKGSIKDKESAEPIPEEVSLATIGEAPPVRSSSTEEQIDLQSGKSSRSSSFSNPT